MVLSQNIQTSRSFLLILTGVADIKGGLILSAHTIGKPYVSILAKYVPPYGLDIENIGEEQSYISNFFNKYVEFFLPYLMKKVKEKGMHFEDCNILDIGCGGGKLAGAVLLSRIANYGIGKYTGIDIRTELIEWLTKIYDEHDFIEFKKVFTDKSIDYCSAVSTGGATVCESDGIETKFSVLHNHYDIQWSNSVFTHLTPAACRNMLRTIYKSSKRDCLQMNTWLIIDDESRYSMLAGLSDRQLPIDAGHFLTYSKNNPLVCTAYKEDFIYSEYERAGLEILSIEKGSWRGSMWRNDAHIYQDIIISAKMEE